MANLFDPKYFGKRIRIVLATHQIQQRDVGKKIGLGLSTICRASKGHGISVEAYLRLSKWLEKMEKTL